MKGKYYIFEGGDLTGKSTMAKMVAEWLTEQGVKSVVAPQPGATEVGQKLRQMVKRDKTLELGKETEAMIFVLDHLSFVETKLNKLLGDGISVISDRNDHISGSVYQVINGIDSDRLDTFYSIVNTPKTDGIFVMRASPDVLKDRAGVRDGDNWDRYESNREFMDKVYSAYDYLLEGDSGNRINSMVKEDGFCCYVDADRTIPQVFSEVITIISKQLK